MAGDLKSLDSLFEPDFEHGGVSSNQIVNNWDGGSSNSPSSSTRTNSEDEGFGGDLGRSPSPPVQPHLCGLCSKTFKTKSNLNQHLRTHSSSGYNCEVCGRYFVSESGLRYHRLSAHGGDRPFPCSACPMSFLQNKLLQKHIRSCHSEDRRFPCPYCESSFKRKDNADRHIRDTHSLVGKLFECQICEGRFMSRSRLSQHLRLHGEAHPSWECSLCSKRFLRQKNLRLHVLKTHVQGPGVLKCLSCDFSFLFPSELTSHLKYNPGHDILEDTDDMLLQDLMM